MILHVSLQYLLEIPLQGTFELGIHVKDKIQQNDIQRKRMKPMYTNKELYV